MALEVSIISSEIIKPSSPTPRHLTNHSLSIIDQSVPPVPVCCILFYPAATVEGISTSNPMSILKSSLSDTLADFYPLAGRISDNKSIKCSDEGVNFFEAGVVGRNLDQVVSEAIAEEMEQLLPNDNFHGLAPNVLLSIQFNRFECGGMALGVRIAHKASDASSLNLFLQNWAASARGDLNKIVRPKYDLTSIFPGKDSVSSTLVFPSRELNPKLVTKRFVFSASNLAALKAKCAKNPTRVEVVTALIWRSAMSALRATRADAKPTSRANLAVNLRGRLSPPISNQHVGNMVMFATGISGTEETQFDSLVDTIHTAITRVDGEFVRQLQFDEGFLARTVELLQEVENFEVYRFTSWCRFPFYETDFGWGRPILTSTAGLLVPNRVVLMDTKDGEGVDAWVALNEQEMIKFEVEPDIIAFTSSTANSPLIKSASK